VLTAVVPAGAKAQAGTRSSIFLEAVPEAELPEPPPTLSPKQKKALEILRSSPQPRPPKHLARKAGCGPGPVEALLVKGVARRVVRRLETFADQPVTEEEPAPPVTLNADQFRAWAPIEAALRDGGFHAFLLHGVTG